MNIATQAAQIGLDWDSRTGAVTVPIYQTATFRHPGLGQSTGYDYSRSGNPTRQALEEGMARLDRGARGFAYSTGMAAITSILFLFKSGDHLVVTEDLYGGTYRLFEQCLNQYGLSFTYVDTSDMDAVRRAIRPATKALFVESLTNPMLKVAVAGPHEEREGQGEPNTPRSTSSGSTLTADTSPRSPNIRRSRPSGMTGSRLQKRQKRPIAFWPVSASWTVS